MWKREATSDQHNFLLPYPLQLFCPREPSTASRGEELQHSRSPSLKWQCVAIPIGIPCGSDTKVLKEPTENFFPFHFSQQGTHTISANLFNPAATHAKCFHTCSNGVLWSQLWLLWCEDKRWRRLGVVNKTMQLEEALLWVELFSRRSAERRSGTQTHSGWRGAEDLCRKKEAEIWDEPAITLTALQRLHLGYSWGYTVFSGMIILFTFLLEMPTFPDKLVGPS